MSRASTHPDCGSDCPCWERGAREEAAFHRVRRTVREMVGYIRAVGDSDPTISPEDMADRIYRVYGRKPAPDPIASYQLDEDPEDAISAIEANGQAKDAARRRE